MGARMRKALPGAGRFRALVGAAEEPPELTPEDDAILDRIWDSIGAERGLAKARGRKIKPGEHVVRGDGRVWVGQLSGPPLPLGKRESQRYRDGLAARAKQAAPLHERVLDTIAKMPATAPFRDRIAISHLYDRMVADGMTTSPLETFKRDLVAEGGARRLRLERLDLREGLPDDVRERSHVRWGTDRVHFVVIPGDVHGDRTDGGPVTRRGTAPAVTRQARTPLTDATQIPDWGTSPLRRTDADWAEARAIVDEVIARNEKNVAEYRAGKDKAFNALVGQVMKASQGKANPAQAGELLRQRLGSAGS
jgi:hypothetical protein